MRSYDLCVRRHRCGGGTEGGGSATTSADRRKETKHCTTHIMGGQIMKYAPIRIKNAASVSKSLKSSMLPAHENVTMMVAIRTSEMTERRRSKMRLESQ